MANFTYTVESFDLNSSYNISSIVYDFTNLQPNNTYSIVLKLYYNSAFVREVVLNNLVNSVSNATVSLQGSFLVDNIQIIMNGDIDNCGDTGYATFLIKKLNVSSSKYSLDFSNGKGIFKDENSRIFGSLDYLNVKELNASIFNIKNDIDFNRKRIHSLGSIQLEDNGTSLDMYGDIKTSLDDSSVIINAAKRLGTNISDHDFYFTSSGLIKNIKAPIEDLDAANKKYVDDSLDGKSDTGHNHDDRYYTESESDARYLKLSGGTITGAVTFNNNINWRAKRNFILNQIADNDEWSFDISRNGFTGGYWQVWDSAKQTLLKVEAESGKVTAPYTLYEGSKRVYSDNNKPSMATLGGKTSTEITTEINNKMDAHEGASNPHNITPSLIGAMPSWDKDYTDLINKPTLATLDDDASHRTVTDAQIGSWTLKAEITDIEQEITAYDTNIVTPALANKMSTSHPANNITSTHLYMANGDGFIWNDSTNKMYVRKDGADYELWDKDNLTNNNQLINGAGYLTAHQDISGKADLSGAVFSGSIEVVTGDGATSVIRARGSNQGTGVIEVGQSSTYGGGISYNGDGTPSWVSGEVSDEITFYRLSSGTRSKVFSYSHNSDIVKFVSTPTVDGNNVYHSGNLSIGTLWDKDYNDLINKPTITSLGGIPNSGASVGDLLVGNQDGTFSKIGLGSTGKVLKAGALGPYWAVDETGSNNYLSGISGSGNGAITLTRSGLDDLTLNLVHTHDDRYYTEGEIDSKLSLKADKNSPTFTGTGTIPVLSAGYIRGNHGDDLGIWAGEAYGWQGNISGEYVWLGAENGIKIVSSPDNLSSGWAGRNEATLVKADGSSDFPGAIKVNGQEVVLANNPAITWNRDYSDLINRPANLSYFAEDASHRTVTDTQISDWNSKASDNNYLSGASWTPSTKTLLLARKNLSNISVVLDGITPAMIGAIPMKNTADAILNVGHPSTSNEAEIILDSSNSGSPQIGFTEHGDMSWAIGGDDGDNSFKIHGVAGATIPTLNNLSVPHFEITTSGAIYNKGVKMVNENDLETWWNTKVYMSGSTMIINV